MIVINNLRRERVLFCSPGYANWIKVDNGASDAIKPSCCVFAPN